MGHIEAQDRSALYPQLQISQFLHMLLNMMASKDKDQNLVQKNPQDWLPAPPPPNKKDYVSTNHYPYRGRRTTIQMRT